MTEIRPYFDRKKDFIILEELGRNSLAGRVTFKAKENRTNEIVVIKKFQFLSNNWDGYKLIEKEIETLSNLDHPNIPKYLGQYEDEQGFCLVQEYINAPSLASFGQLPIAEVTDIALSVLDLLVYLQELSPPVFHRDIKPENILYNRETKQVYLVDFGVAKTGTGTTTSSTINGGTLGFMPPEQLLGKKLNQSSDLYSLGLTLICLLGGISSAEINQFINHRFEVDFSKTIPIDINWKFRDFITKMINPDQTQRFVNAQTAKKALVELKNTKSSSFLSKDDEEKSESSLFKILLETKMLVYIPVVTITLGISYYVFYPLINSIISLQENPNFSSVFLRQFKDKLIDIINIIAIIIIPFSILPFIIKARQEGDFEVDALRLPAVSFLLIIITKAIIELVFSNM